MRWMIGLLAFLAAVPIVFAIALFVWGWTALPDDLSPPDPSAVPGAVHALFRAEIGEASVSGLAAKLLIQGPIRPSRYTIASLLGSLWITSRWTAEEAISQIALRSYFGHGFHGIQEASLGYFGKPIEALTLSQTAALVALTKSPSRYSPWCHPDRLEPRIASLLDQPAPGALDGLLAPPANACNS